MKEKIYIKPEFKQNKYKELIPSFEDLVFQYPGSLLPPGTGSVTLEKNSKFGRPILAGNQKIDNVKLFKIKSLLSMGKACFIEAGDGTFLQWKGIGPNPASENMFRPEAFSPKDYGIRYPLGKKGPFPLIYIEAGGVKLLRFEGTAFYEDLLEETKMTNIVRKLGVDAPEVVATIKFSQDFCQKNNLPVPANDDPSDSKGQKLIEYVEQYKDQIDPDIYQRMLTSYDIQKDAYESGVLGQNIRKMKNVWRFDDIVRALNEKDPAKSKEMTEYILSTSKKILEKEFGQKFTDSQFVARVAEILGKNTAIMLKERIVQGGSIDTHKQDITLSGQICDWDGACVLKDEFLEEHPYKYEESGWIFKDEETGKPFSPQKVAEHKKAWQKEKEILLYRQVFLIAGHLKPMVDAYARNTDENYEDEAIASFLRSMSDILGQEGMSNLKKYLQDHPEVYDVKLIAGKTDLKQKNLAGHQEFFNKIIKAIEKILESKKHESTRKYEASPVIVGEIRKNKIIYEKTITPNTKVCLIGDGQGMDTEQFLKMGVNPENVHSVNYEQSEVDQANKTVLKGTKVKMKQADATDLESLKRARIAENSQEVVTLMHVLEVPIIRGATETKLVENLAKILKPNGELLVSQYKHKFTRDERELQKEIGIEEITAESMKQIYGENWQVEFKRQYNIDWESGMRYGEISNVRSRESLIKLFENKFDIISEETESEYILRMKKK